jgi:hypothetical protein
MIADRNINEPDTSRVDATPADTNFVTLMVSQ